MTSSTSIARRSGLAAIFMEDPTDPPPEPEPLLNRVTAAVAGALDHTVFLLVLWIAAVTSRQMIGGGQVRLLRYAPEVAMFCVAYFIIDVAVALYWPEMVDNLVQAGMFHIATVMFACLPETTV